MKNVDINKMNIVELSANEYKCLLTTNNVPCFYECDFLELNAKKVDKIHYLLGRDSKDRILFAIGEKDREWKAPFSAPFSNLVLLKDDVSVAQIWEFVIELIKFAESKAAKKIEIYPPSEIYESHITARFINALLGNGFRLLHEDINYYFDLSLLDIDTYGQKLCRMGRKNLKIALEN